MANPQSALANCASVDGSASNPGTVFCGTGATLDTSTAAIAVPTPNDSRNQVFNGPVLDSQVDATVLSGNLATGAGLAVTNNQAGGNIAMNNLGTVLLTAGIPSAGGPDAMDLTANGGNVSYVGDGGTVSAGGFATNGLVLTTTGAGTVSVGSSAAPVTGGTFLGGLNGIVASTVSGDASVFLSGGMVTAVGGDGILATSGTGAVSVTTGPATGGVSGVEAASMGGAVTVTTNGVATGGATGAGIVAGSVLAGGAGNVRVTANNAVTGGVGIAAFAIGAGNTGNVTVVTFAPVTGAAGNGIAASAVDGATQVTVLNSGTTITGTGAGASGINSTSNGAGAVGVSIASGTTVVDMTGIGVGLNTAAGSGSASLCTNGTITGLGSFANPAILVTNNNTAASPVTINNGVLGAITNATNSPTGWAVVASGPGGTPTNVQPLIVDNSGVIDGRIQLGGGVDAFNNLATGVWNVGGASNQLGNGSTISNAAGGTINIGAVAGSTTSVTFTNTGAQTGADTIINAGLMNIGTGAGSTTSFTLDNGSKISNALGGTINIGSGPGSVTSFTFANTAAQTGTDTVTNAGLINSTGAVTFTFDPAATVINNSGIFNVGSVAGSPTESTAFTTTAGGMQTVANTGTYNVLGLLPQTGTHVGTLSFTGAGGSSFANAGGVINLQADGGATTNAATLNSSLSGTSDLNYTYTWGTLAASSYNFTGGANSLLKVDAFLGAPGSTSDRLAIGGNATGITQIQVNNTNTGPGVLNTTGITVVAVQGTGSNDFVVSPTTTNYVNFGPLGSISNGLFIDPLLYVPGGATSANAQPNGNAYKLFSLPGPFLTQLPLAITAAQNIWQQTAIGWEDRQEELRSYYRRGRAAGGQAYGGGADLPTRKSPPPPAAGGSGTPAVWVKAVASRTDLTDQENLGKAFGNPLFNGLGWSNDYKQDTYGVVGGVDGGRSAVFSPADSIVFGVMGGYLDSHVSFDSSNVLSGPSSSTGFNYTGGTVGVSADYMNGGFFIDALGKADLLDLKVSGIPGGSNTQTVSSDTYGFLGNVGYRFEYGQYFVEPLGTFQYIDANLGGLSLPGSGVNVKFNRGDAFDVAGGVRAGGIVMDDRVHYLEAAVTAKVWDPASVHNTANFTSIPNVAGTAFALDPKFTDAYGEVGLQLDWINRGPGWSAFAKADGQFNQQFVTITAKGGVTYGF